MTFFGKIGLLISFELSSFIVSISRPLKLLSIMLSINYFGQVVQEILQNNNLQIYFGISEITGFVPTFWNFLAQKCFQKDPSFFNLNAHIPRTGDARKINAYLLKQGMTWNQLKPLRNYLKPPETSHNVIFFT